MCVSKKKECEVAILRREKATLLVCGRAPSVVAIGLWLIKTAGKKQQPATAVAASKMSVAREPLGQ